VVDKCAHHGADTPTQCAQQQPSATLDQRGEILHRLMPPAELQLFLRSMVAPHGMRKWDTFFMCLTKKMSAWANS
jgi:hypothetical protein